MIEFTGQMSLGLVLALSALGSALGIGIVGQAAAAAWSKEARAGRPLSFAYVILIGLPLSQTVYGAILMLIGLNERVYDAEVMGRAAGALFGIALAGGVAELASAWVQGRIGAAAVRALSEGGGQGLAFMIIAMGIAETVGLFAFVFLLMVLP